MLVTSVNVACYLNFILSRYEAVRKKVINVKTGIEVGKSGYGQTGVKPRFFIGSAFDL